MGQGILSMYQTECYMHMYVWKGELIIVSEGQMPDREFTSLRTYLQATD